MKKKLAMGLILCLALGAFAACSQDTTEGEETQGQEQQEEGTEDGAGEEEEMTEVPLEDLDVTQYDTYFEMASAYLNLSTTEKYYDGDYEFYATYNRITANNDGSVITVNYQIVGGDRENLEVDYTIANDCVVEEVYRDGEVADRYHSLIPGFIVLDGEIATDNAWNQEFTYNGETYTAETTIIRAGEDSFTTETVVQGLEEYPDGTYREERTYTMGEGLTYFAQSRPIEEGNKEASVLAYQLQEQ